MEPDLYNIGKSAAEAEYLKEIHTTLVRKLAEKQTQISELLSRAEELVSQQPTEGQAMVYSAMSSSLNKAWRELLEVLGKRGHLLEMAADCFVNADAVCAAARRITDPSFSADWGDSVESIERLIQVFFTLFSPRTSAVTFVEQTLTGPTQKFLCISP
ncbi:unnamed protein product [Dibothriocephalus latus]|uniref:Uncharacterized protein n=1 Tax=Dibothriocephalus latus TaxID=60516 RepID=A0A3P7LZV1_DIBLA|nr:unnamed protein product [Dibothriocephalus latus]